MRYPANFEYARTSNPTRKAFEDCIAKLENGKYGLAFSSGLGATTTLMHMLSPGDHVISVDDVYGGTQRYFRTIATKFGLEFSFVDFNTNDGKDLESAFKENTKLVWLETPSNPTLTIFDIVKTAELAHKHGALLVVDNTFASPYFQRPLDLGADIVLHSVTKFLNGHSDVVMGAVVTSNDEVYDKMKYLQNSMGAIPSPFDSFLALRGLKTLHVRMQRHEENAKVVAAFLNEHPKIRKVTYPGLESHPQHELAKKQMTGFGGMITFYIDGGIDQARQFLENLKVIALAESLGGVESLIESPVIMTHASVPAEQRAKLGIDDSMIRLSVGIEEVEDLIADIKNALDKVTK